jgi:hypothetical protein
VPGPIGPDGIQGVPGPGNSFQTVATATALPAAASNTGRAYYVIDTAVVMVSDGTRWRTVYGDTGLRNVSAMLTDPNILQSAPAPLAYLRRQAHTVEFYCDFQAIAATPASPFAVIALPAGFRSGIAYAATAMYVPVTAYGVNRQTILASGASGVLNAYTVPAGTRDRYHGTWLTGDAWPTNLPGTAVGVPN